MDRQKTFETVARHLFSQGQRAASKRPMGGDPENVCRYRMKKDGKTLMCAAGVLIPDSMYKRGMEGSGISFLLEKDNKLRAAMDVDSFTDALLINDLQRAHDRENSWVDSASMRSVLSNVAVRYELNDDFLDQLSFADRPMSDAAERLSWVKDRIVSHRGVSVVCIEEQGRRFWAYRHNREWSLRQEASSFEEACQMIDDDLDERVPL